MKTIVMYHHRTQGHGAEGVHIRGIQNALKGRGIEVCDISLVQNRSSRTAMPEKARPALSTSIFAVITNKLPNVIFKILEIAYNAYPIIYGAWKIWSVKKPVGKIAFIYDRYAYFSFGLTLLSIFNRIPYVLEVNTTCLDYDVREIKFRKLARLIEKAVFTRTTLITVVSGYLKDKIMQEYNIPDTKIIVTPNAVTPADFDLNEQIVINNASLESAKRFSSSKLIIGFVGVFVPWHGLDFLLEAFKKIHDELGKELELGLLLVGDGPIRNVIDNMIETYGLDDCVHITGMADHAHMKHYINLFDIAVMPDSNPFGSPMKIFEYMVMEKPVVAPQYGPINDVIINGKTGCLFPPKDLPACINTIKHLISDPDLRSSIGHKARTQVLNHHTWDKNLTKILEEMKINNSTLEVEEVLCHVSVTK